MEGKKTTALDVFTRILFYFICNVFVHCILQFEFLDEQSNFHISLSACSVFHSDAKLIVYHLSHAPAFCLCVYICKCIMIIWIRVPNFYWLIFVCLKSKNLTITAAWCVSKQWFDDDGRWWSDGLPIIKVINWTLVCVCVIGTNHLFKYQRWLNASHEFNFIIKCDFGYLSLTLGPARFHTVFFTLVMSTESK